MDGSRIGRGLRALRIRASSTQEEVADGAKVPRAVIASVERGDLARVRVEQLQAIAVALRADLDIVLRWNGTELDRLLKAGHSAMHELVVGILTATGWEAIPERSFSIWGERGVIDLLAWHAATRSLLVVELKTEIVEVQQAGPPAPSRHGHGRAAVGGASAGQPQRASRRPRRSRRNQRSLSGSSSLPRTRSIVSR